MEALGNHYVNMDQCILFKVLLCLVNAFVLAPMFSYTFCNHVFFYHYYAFVHYLSSSSIYFRVAIFNFDNAFSGKNVAVVK